MLEIDSLGSKCPQPIIDLAKMMKSHPSEDQFLLFSDDPATISDLNAWSRMTGHEVSVEGEERFLIRRRTN
jgi:TusA-related sulfurtransferase